MSAARDRKQGSRLVYITSHLSHSSLCRSNARRIGGRRKCACPGITGRWDRLRVSDDSLTRATKVNERRLLSTSDAGGTDGSRNVRRRDIRHSGQASNHLIRTRGEEREGVCEKERRGSVVGVSIATGCIQQQHVLRDCPRGEQQSVQDDEFVLQQFVPGQ